MSGWKVIKHDPPRSDGRCFPYFNTTERRIRVVTPTETIVTSAEYTAWWHAGGHGPPPVAEKEA